MSIRAYRVKKIEYAGESFDLWHDEDLIDFLEGEEDIYDRLNTDGTGFLELPVEIIRRALEEVQGISSFARKALEADLKWAKENNKEHILYNCF